MRQGYPLKHEVDSWCSWWSWFKFSYITLRFLVFNLLKNHLSKKMTLSIFSFFHGISLVHILVSYHIWKLRFNRSLHLHYCTKHALRKSFSCEELGKRKAKCLVISAKCCVEIETSLCSYFQLFLEIKIKNIRHL